MTVLENVATSFTPLSFEDAYKLDIRDAIEQKDNINYLSWAYAVKLLKTQVDPKAYWKFLACEFFADGTAMVKVLLYVNEIEYEQCLSVMHRAKITTSSGKSFNGITANASPNSKDISDAQQRCLVKAIATATGIGLSLYSGEVLAFEDARGLNEEDIRKAYWDCKTVDAIGATLKELLHLHPNQKDALVAGATTRKNEVLAQQAPSAPTATTIEALAEDVPQ